VEPSNGGDHDRCAGPGGVSGPDGEAHSDGGRGGRPAATSAQELAQIAQTLFLERGYDEVSVADITTAAGVSRRTFFRYLPSKADVLWVATPAEMARLHRLLAEAPKGSGGNAPGPVRLLSETSR
jgi:AcrR family transcriptional regulator